MKDTGCEDTDYGGSVKNEKLKNLCLQKFQCFGLGTEATGISFGRCWAAGFDQSMDHSKWEFN